MFALVIAVCSGQPLLSQNTFTKFYDLNDGLAPGRVNQLSQDHLGYLWVCNQNGVSKFDGRNFTTYYGQFGDTMSLRSSESFDIAHQPNGDVWIATAQGLSKYHRAGNTFTTYSTADGLTMDISVEVLLESDSVLWTGHWWGLDRIDLTSMQVQNYRPFPATHDSAALYRSLNHAYALRQSPYTGEIFSAHTKSLFKFSYDADSLIEILTDEPWELTYITDFNWLNDSIMVLGMSERNWLVELNLNSHATRVVHVPGLRLARKIVRLEEGRLQILDELAGLMEYSDHNTYTAFSGFLVGSKDDTRRSYSAAFRDRSGRDWIGLTTGLGLYVARDVQFFEPPEGIGIFSAKYDARTGYCVTPGYGGLRLWRYIDGEFDHLPYDFTSMSPYAIAFAPAQQAFYSIENGHLVAFHPQRHFRRIIPLTRSINNRAINSIKPQPAGLDIAHGHEILHISYTGVVDTLFQNHTSVFDFAILGERTFYSELGKVKVADGAGQVQTIYEDLPFVPPRSLILVGDTALWFSQTHAGMIKMDITSPEYPYSIIGNDQGISSQIINTINRVGDQLLLSGSYAMYCYDLKSDRLASTLVNTDELIEIYFDDPIHILDADFAFTTVHEGIVMFPYRQSPDSLLHLQIRSMQIADDTLVYAVDDAYDLKHWQNDINIVLEAAYFGESRALHYGYKLEDDDTRWTEIGQSPTLSITNLAPGEYSINARVRTDDGQILTLPQPLNISIKPPWWQLWWVRLLAIVAIVTGVYFYYRRRISRLKAAHDLEKKLIGLEQVALKSQMNPHFLFNCLNGIRTLIELQEGDQAVMYVNHLSALLRDTLTYHDDIAVTLEKELEMTENYLMLAKLRFGDKINWAVDVDHSLDTAKLEVPPFILQPLVENAIWHGIKHSEDPGEILVIIRPEGEKIAVHIIDNGIGLERAAELQQGQMRTRKHIGLQLVRKRLETVDGEFVLRPRAVKQGAESIIYLNQ